jgi:hypothetical protein
MPVLNTADKLYVGNTAVDRVYQGTTKVWEANLRLKLSGLLSWVSAKKLTGYADNAPINSLTEGSSYKRVFTPQGSAPLYRSNISGYPRISFNGSNQSLFASGFNPGTIGLTLISVHRQIATPNYGMVIVYDPGGGRGSEVRYNAASTQLQLVHDYGGGSGLAPSGSIATTIGRDYIVWAEFGPAGTKLYINNVLDINVGGFAMQNLAGKLYMGARTDGYYASMLVSEQLAYGRILNATERNSLFNLLVADWNIPLGAE